MHAPNPTVSLVPGDRNVEMADENEVDPVHDLRPMCPKCHAVIHIGGEHRSLEEVRQMLQSRS